MNYEILYSKSFIKTPKGRIIPLILAGSNNCTQFNPYTGREVAERNWFPACNTELIFEDGSILEGEVIKRAQSVNPNSEIFKIPGGWITGKDYPGWWKRGIKSAAFVEDYRERNNRPVTLVCELNFRTEDSGWSCRSMAESVFTSIGLKREDFDKKFIRTSAELDDWLDSIKSVYDMLNKLKQDRKISDYYLDIRFLSDTSIHVYKNRSFPVVLKNRGGRYSYGYVSEIAESRISYSKNISDAIVFSNSEEAQNAITKYRLTGFNLKEVLYKNASKEKPYIIKIIGGIRNGLFVKTIGGRNLYYCSDEESAKGFANEKEANKAINAIIYRGYTNLTNADLELRRR